MVRKGILSILETEFFMKLFLLLIFGFIVTASTAQTVLETETFEMKMQALNNEQLVDVRTASEFSKSYIAGALNIDINGARFEEQVAALDKNKPVMVYCLSGARSAKAASYMLKQGFREVYHLQGGMLKWNASRKPVVAIKSAKGGLSKQEFDALTKKESLVLVDFHARWCAPCIKMAPALDSIRSETANFELVKVNVDENADLVREMNVNDLPRLFLFKNGKQVWSHAGMLRKAAIEEVIRNHQ
jgi:thioredoxin 1